MMNSLARTSQSSIVTIKEMLKFTPEQLPLKLNLDREQLKPGKTIHATQEHAVMAKHRVAVLPSKWFEFDTVVPLRFMQQLELGIEFHPRLYSAGAAGRLIFSEANLEGFYDNTVIKAVNDALSRVAYESNSPKVVQLQIRPGAVSSRMTGGAGSDPVGTWPDWAAIEFDRDPETGYAVELPWSTILQQNRIVVVGESKLEVPADTVRAVPFAHRCDVDWIAQLQDYQVATGVRFGCVILNKEVIVAESTRASSGASTNPGTRANSEEPEFRPGPIQKRFTMESVASLESGGAPPTVEAFEKYKPKRQLSIATQASSRKDYKLNRRDTNLGSSIGSLPGSITRSGFLTRPSNPTYVAGATESRLNDLQNQILLETTESEGLSNFDSPEGSAGQPTSEPEFSSSDSDDADYTPSLREFDIDKFRIRSFRLPTQAIYDHEQLQPAEALFLLVLHASNGENRRIGHQWVL